MKKIRMNLDGRSIEAPAGSTLLEVARAQGIDVPSLCFDPRLPPYASCFICIVEVEGRRGAAPACATRAEEGMVVRTNTEGIRELRRIGLELLLSNHHGDCIAPCNMACPAGIDIRSYLSEATRGNFADALRIIKERNPFPSVCGRICPHPCEDQCRRKLVDDAVSINQVKRYISDRDRCSADGVKPSLAPRNGKKIAVIGGGPGGMSAAYYLAVLGYSVTVFEAMEKAGGMLRYGVPDYRLPPEVLDLEIERILELGVELRTGKTWGKDFRLEDLRKDGFSAIVAAIGAWTGQAMGVEGESRDGVWSGIAILEKVNRGETPELGERVAVVGGGNTAIDCARSALRLGAKEVSIVYRRGRAEMPANPEEIHEAEEEGVIFRFLTAPTGFSGSGPINMRCVQMQLGAPDASGRRRPEPVPGSETDIVADSVIAAIGQKVRWDGFDADGLKLTRWGTPDADPVTLRSVSHDDVFVCGDCLTGPATAIEAIAGGRRAALAAHARLSGVPQELSPHAFNIRKGALKDLSPEEYAHYPKMPRAKVAQLDAFSRARSCSEVSHTLAEDDAVEEARRCLLCGCQEVDTCLLRRYCEQYGATGELFPGEKTTGTKMPKHPFIDRDHQKCILCGRCVRVCAELQGSGAIGLAARGFVTEVSSAWGGRLSEYACKSCGQCVAACPAGALSARFKTVQVPAWTAAGSSSVCPYCGIGCVLDYSIADDRIQRLNNKIDAKPSNGMVCAKAFSGFDLLEMDDRLKEPMIKEKGAWRKAKWDEAMKAAALGLMKSPGKAAAVLGSTRLTNEAVYLLQKIGRAALGTNNIGGPGLPDRPDAAARAFGQDASPASLGDICGADLIINTLPDLEGHYPSVFAAIREAAIKGAVIHGPQPGAVYLRWLKAAVKQAGPRKPEGFRELAAALSKRQPAGRPAAAEAAAADSAGAELMAARRPLIVADPALLPPRDLAALADILILVGKPHALLLLRAGANAQGAIDMGLSGTRLPGHLAVSGKAARAALEKLWGIEIPAWEGLGAAGIVEHASSGGLSALLSWGDTGLAGLRLKGVFAVSGEWVTPDKRHPASIVFPAALFAEDAGSFTSFDRKVNAAQGWRPAGSPLPNWSVISDLARHLGLKTPETLQALRREISLASPLHRKLGWEKWGAGLHCAGWKAEISPSLLVPAAQSALPEGLLPDGDIAERFIRTRLADVAAQRKVKN